MRLEKAQNLVRLALMMSSTTGGVSLAEIQQEFEVGRRTAERMRDAIIDLFPADAVTVQVDHLRQKRWALRRWNRNAQAVDDLISFSATDLAALDQAAKVAAQEGLDQTAEAVRDIQRKVQALLPADRLRRVEPDVEALAEAEGLAMRPGPRPRVDPIVVQGLRVAIIGCRKVTIHYRARGSKAVSRQSVRPYGFLYGNRHYLVAFNENEQVLDYRLFALANITEVDLLPDGFDRDPDFSLQSYAERSFGVFQEDPVNVVWRFAPDAADDATTFLFHPTQQVSDEPDGSVIVRFRAGGLLEMAWHLFTWGDAVEVVEPVQLRELLAELKES